MTDAPDAQEPSTGIWANAGQFSLLVGVNALVGAVLGLERSALPVMAEQRFHLTGTSAILSFIAVFGLSKALTNYAAGRLSDTYGRRPVLLAGWILALPVAPLLIWAPSWGWVLLANVLLGVSQGLAWSTAVIMKIDLAGPKQRGLATGLNEFAGYIAVAASALLTGWLAHTYGLHTPFALGLLYSAVGLALSWAVVRETSPRTLPHPTPPPAHDIFWRTTLSNPTLSSVTQAGFVNNLNDGMAWGLFPLLFVHAGLNLAELGMLTALYPAVWGLAQLVTGAASDHWGRKRLIVGGMGVQAAGIAAVALGAFVERGVWVFAAGQVALGLGTAMVYPTLLAAIGDVAAPSWRASAVGVYRLWRDLGYAAGALVAGLFADHFGVPAAILVTALLTALSGVVAQLRMPPPD